ncbi:IS30 family transposase [Mycobacterium sp. URHB0021]
MTAAVSASRTSDYWQARRAVFRHHGGSWSCQSCSVASSTTSTLGTSRWPASPPSSIKPPTSSSSCPQDTQPMGWTPLLAACASSTPISSRYLTQDDRIEIADGLAAGEPVKAIAERILRTFQSVYRGIARNRKPDGTYQSPGIPTPRLISVTAGRNASPPMKGCDWRWQRSWRRSGVLPRSVAGCGADIVVGRRGICALWRSTRVFTELCQRAVTRPPTPAPVGGRDASGTKDVSNTADSTAGWTLCTASRDALIAMFTQLPLKLRRTLTWDQGNEMFLHERIEEATGLKIYFADPHSPWQRGSNENSNGLVRQDLPKGTDRSVWSDDQLRQITDELNDRPRLWLKDNTAAQLLRRWERQSILR